MSQFQSFESGAGPGPGPILDLVGDNGVIVAPTSPGGTIFIKGQTTSAFGFSKVNGDAAAHTLTIVPLSNTVATADASGTFFPLAFVPLDVNQAVVMSAHVIGVKTDYSAACGGYVTGVARRDAVNPAVFVGQSIDMSRDSMTGTPIFGILLNGNNLNVIVSGVALETWNWTCTYEWTYQIL